MWWHGMEKKKPTHFPTSELSRISLARNGTCLWDFQAFWTFRPLTCVASGERHISCLSNFRWELSDTILWLWFVEKCQIQFLQLINVVNPSIYSPAWNPRSSSWLIASFQTSSLDESDSSSAISLPCQRWHWHWTCHVEKERIATNTFHTWLTWHKSYCFWSRLELSFGIRRNFPGAFRHLLCINHSCCIKCLMRCDFDLFRSPQISCNKSIPSNHLIPLRKIIKHHPGLENHGSVFQPNVVFAPQHFRIIFP